MSESNADRASKTRASAIRAACETITQLMDPLDPHERVRVMAAVICLYDVDAARRVCGAWGGDDAF